MRTADRPTPGTLAVLIALAIAAPVSAGAAQEPQKPTFAAAVSITRVKVAVLDDDGEPVAGLGPEAFRVFDDGEEQDVRLVLDPDEAPLDLALVLDYSASIADGWPDARERVHAFLDALGDDDCVYLLPFNARVGPGLRAGPDDETLRAVVERFPMRGVTRLYDALFTAYSALASPASAAGADAPLAARMPGSCGTRGRVVERRPAIVLLTDGADEGSGYSYRDVLMQAWRSDVPVFPVAVGMAAISDTDLDGYRTLGVPRSAIEQVRTTRRQLAELARVSGGRGVSQRQIGDGYDEVLSLLRGYHVIGYRSPEPRRRGWHEVDVRLTGKSEYRVVVQPGYYGVEVDPRPVEAALETARRALQQRDFDTALRWFQIAGGHGIDMGLPDLGAGIAHEALGQHAAARDAYRRSLRRYPGLGAVQLRLARASLRLADLGAAWDHALRADAVGEDATEVLESLRIRDPSPPDVAAMRARPVLYLVRPPEPSLEAQLDLDVVLQGLGRRLEQRPDVVLTRRPAAATHYVRLEVDDAGNGAVRGDLELWSADGRRLESGGLRVDDLEASDLSSRLDGPLEKLLRRLRSDS